MNSAIEIVSIAALQPSQLYISRAKLEAVEQRLRRDNEDYESIPVKLMNDRLVILDGHTRLYSLFLQGVNQVRIHHDQDELDWRAYEICVQWCLDEGVSAIADLADRIIDPVDYQSLWLDRCAAMHQSLEQI